MATMLSRRLSLAQARQLLAPRLSKSATSTSGPALARFLHAAPPSKEKANNPHQVLTLPNAITFTRILSTPYLGYLIVSGSYPAAIGVLGAAGFSDWLDGYLARKLDQKTIVGTFLDPLADKVMVGTLCVSMGYAGLLPLPLVVVIFGRDLLLIGGTLYHRYHTKTNSSAFFQTDDLTSFEVNPSNLSKANTALQFATLGGALLNAAFQMPGDLAMNVMFGSVALSTFASGSMYLRDYLNKSGMFQHLKR